MMWWGVYVIALSWSLLTSLCQDVNVTVEEFESMLDDAASDVLSQHLYVTAKRKNAPPYFQMPEDFMRSFVPGTGVGNREELIIDGVSALPVYEDTPFSRFLFKHFNDTDYLAGILDNYVIVLKINRTVDVYLELTTENPVLRSFIESGVVKDVVFFTRIEGFSEVLSVAIVSENARTSLVYIYDVIGDYAVMVSSIELNVDLSNSYVMKIAYVQSSYGGSLVVLTSTMEEAKLVYHQRGHSKQNHYIEARFPSAVDFTTFSVHGHGYLAVANGTLCEIFKMDEYVGSHILFDRLGPFSNIVDLEYFRLGFDHYLVVADLEGQHLYTWKRGEFSPKQNILLPNIAQIYASSIESCRDEVMLFTILSDGRPILYTFGGESEEFVRTDIEIPEGYSIKPGSLTTYTSSESVLVLFANLRDQLQAFLIKTSLKSLGDPILVQGEEVSKAMKKIQDTLRSQNKEIKRLKEMLKNAVRGTGTQQITAVQHFDDISVTIETVVEKVNEYLLEWEDSSLTLEEYRRGADDLEKHVRNLEKLIAEMEKQMPDVVRLDQDAVVSGQKIFSGHVSAEILMTTSINLQNVAGVDLPQLQKDVYRLDKPQIIEGTLTFQESLAVTNNLDVGTTVNGVDISEEVMTTDTQQTSYAEMVFISPFVVLGDLDVSGKVNGLDIGQDVVTLYGTHYIPAHKSFLNGISAHTTVAKLLDGIDVDDLYRRAFTVTGDQTVTGDAAFSTLTTNNIILEGKLNGYDVGEIEKNVVRIDRPAVISGYKQFINNVVIDNELLVQGTVNGLHIPDDLVLTDESKTITGAKEFVGHVTARAIDVKGKIDDINVPGDILTLSGDEEISSTLYFVDGISTEKDIIVEGLVDGVDISEIAKQAMTLNDSQTFQQAIFSGPVTITGDLNVGGLVNDVDLNRLLGDIVYKDEKSVDILSEKSFKRIVADKVRLDNLINGFNVNVDFMTIHGNQTIGGTKVFKNATLNSVYIEDGMIDGVNVDDLYRQRIELAIVENPEVDREIEFVDKVIVGDLTVHGTVNGLQIPNDVVLRNMDAPILNKYFADRVVVDNLIIDGDVQIKNFAGVDLTLFNQSRITLSGDQDIPGDLHLGGVISASRVSISGLVNGIDIADFARNVMSKTKPHQVVTAAKEFSGSVSVLGNIRTSEGVNGFNLSDISLRAFKLLEDNIITVPMEFEDTVNAIDLVVTSDINGVNITRLIEDSLRKDGGLQYVIGETVFQAGFDVVGDILASKVNSLVLVEDVLLKSVPQSVKGQFTFKNMNIDGYLKVKKLINGLNLTEIVPKLAKISEEETIVESSVSFTGSVHVLENIEVGGLVNEVDLKTLFEKVLRKTGYQKITGHKVFRGNVTVIGDVDVKYVNGIDWKQFLDDVVWINKPQVIQSPKTFTNDVYVNGDMFVNGMAHVQLINGKDLQKFVEEAVFIDQPANITGPIVFKDTVEITGNMNADLINGLSLKTDVITIMCSDDGPQSITGQKTFQNMKVFGDVYTDAVNSYDLQALYEDTLLTEENQTVTGSKIIYGDAVFKKDVLPDTVNGMILNRDLVTLDTRQKIEGSLTFQDDVFVKKDLFIKSLLNGVDLQNLSREAVYLKTDQVIDGAYTIENAVTPFDVQVIGTVNNINLKSFDQNVTDFLSETKNSLVIMDQYAEDQCLVSKYLQESLKNTYYALEDLVFHQNLEVAASFVNVQTEDVSLVYVDDSGTVATSVLNVWDRRERKFSSVNFSATPVVRSSSYRIGNVGFTVSIGISSKDSSLSVEMPSSIILESGFTDSFVLLLKEDDVALISLLFPDKKTCLVYLLRAHQENGYVFELDASLSVTRESSSLVLFKQSNVPYLAVSSFHSSHVPSGSRIFTKKSKSWQLLQHIPISGHFVKYFDYHNHHYLAFANNAPTYETKEPKSIEIYRNLGEHDGSIFTLFQKVPFDDARGLETFRFGDSSQLHIVSWNLTRVQIFLMQGESGVKELITLHGTCVRDVKPLLISDDIFLVVGQQNLEKEQEATSFLYKGAVKGYNYKSYDLEYC